MIIYKCTFPNNKIYIGQTTRKLSVRMREHKTDSNDDKNYKYNFSFHRAIRKYGWNNLVWEIIDNCKSVEELDEKEKYWIAFYNSCLLSNDSNGYNRNYGGNGTHHHTDLTKKKMSISASGENSSRSNLNNNDIFKIIEMKKDGIKQKDIAIKFNVQESLISKILSGKRWSSVTGIK